MLDKTNFILHTLLCSFNKASMAAILPTTSSSYLYSTPKIPKTSLRLASKVYVGLRVQSPNSFGVAKSSSSVEFFNSVRKSIESRPRDGKATRSQVTMMPIGTPQVMYNTPDGFEMIDLSDALYRERVIFIGDEINEEFSNQILATMLYLDSLDSSKKLFMFISGPGGDLTPTMAIYDTMQSLNSSVATHCVGFAYNLAAFLLAAGEKGNRCSMPLSRIAFESPAGAARGQADDIRNEADELLRIRDYLFKELSEKTGQPIEKVHKDFSRVKRFTAPEALEYGLIDRILYPNRLDTDAPRRDAPPRDANAGLG